MTWTPERRAAASERMSKVRPIDYRGNPMPKPSLRGAHNMVLSDEDMALVRALIDERQRLMALRKTVREAHEAEMAALTRQIKALSNAEIAEKFGVAETTVGNAAHSCRGLKI